MPKTAVDPFFATNEEPITAGRSAAAIVPSDTADLPHVTSSIYVGGAGNLVVLMADPGSIDSATVTFTAVPVGTVLQIQARRVMATGTTATNLVAIWSQ
jgi:hypothetical protein